MADGRRGDGFRHEDEPFAGDPSVAPVEDGRASNEATPEPLQLDEPEEERLPWLEDDDLVAERRGGGDTARLIGFALLGLLALALIVGLLYWITNRGPDPALVADGGLIEAPEGPVKVRPDNPGGRTFEGTGDVAPGVGEGRARDARLAEEESAASANARRATGADGGAEATGSSETAAAGPVVQVGAYSTRELAEVGWTKLQRQTDALSGVRYRIVEGRADIGTVYRLQATPGGREAADRLCAALKADGVACQVKS